MDEAISARPDILDEAALAALDLSDLEPTRWHDDEDGVLHDSGLLEAFDANRLYWQSWSAPAPEGRRGRVLLVHGYGEHSSRYDHVARALVRAGYDVMTFDARGHGRSTGPRGYVEDYGHYVRDVSLVQAHLERAWPDRGGPLFVLGHSQGGLITLRYALSRPAGVAGFVVTSPMCRIGADVPAWKDAAGRLMSRIHPTLAMPTEIEPVDLSRSPDVVRRYRDDPLVLGVATARWFTEAQGAQDDLFARADELDQPFLLLVAGADRLVDPSATEDLYRLLGSHDRTCEFLPKHFHEVLNEPDWDDSLRGIIAWMERHRAALEAGGPGAEDAI